MGKMLSKVIAALQIGIIDYDDGVLLNAGDLLAKGAGNGSYHSDNPEIEAEEVSAEEIDALKLAIIEALRREQDPVRVAGLIFVLAKSSDPQYKETYIEYLQQFTKDLLTANAGIYQVLIALDNIGETVWERNLQGRTSQSILNIEKNMRQAKTYLSQQGRKLLL